jgi:hypothetical protein
MAGPCQYQHNSRLVPQKEQAGGIRRVQGEVLTSGWH